MGSRLAASILVTLMIGAACAPWAGPTRGEPRAGPGQGPSDAGAPRSRALVMGARFEVGALAGKVVPGLSLPAIHVTKRLFNAAIAMVDGKGIPQPYLTERLPQLNTDTWQVFPDGRMETTYPLRPNLTWHDGQPLTAEDFVFAFRVYVAPGMGQFEPVPQDRIEEVHAPDPRTLRIRWKSLYPDAGVIKERELDPLPRHILERSFKEDPGDVFSNDPYWSREFVGAGPYRLERWEAGSHLDAVAFEGHALGRPKIDRIVVRFIGDENTMLTNVLAGGVDIAMEGSLAFEQAMVLKREWATSQRGAVLINPTIVRFMLVQFRPDYVNPRALLDLRIRRALAYSADREGINQGLFGGELPLAEHYFPATAPYFDELERTAMRYPHDFRRTEQLMNEAGYRKGNDGIYASSSGEPFDFEIWAQAGSREQDAAIVADGWRRAGFKVREHVIPAAQGTDGEVRSSFPALGTSGTGHDERNLRLFSSAQIPSPANRWRGVNYGGWVSGEYDRLWDAQNTTLDASERARQVIRMVQLMTEEVPAIFLFHAANITAHGNSLRGPAVHATGGLPYWNVHEWELGM